MTSPALKAFCEVIDSIVFTLEALALWTYIYAPIMRNKG